MLTDDILDILENTENPVTRAELRELTHARDNVVREAIGQLRDQGHRIISSANTKGYRIARNDAEYLAFRREYVSKALTYMNRVKAMDAHTEGQVSMDE